MEGWENRAKEKKKRVNGRLLKKGQRKEKAALQTSCGAITVGAAGLSTPDHFLNMLKVSYSFVKDFDQITETWLNILEKPWLISISLNGLRKSPTLLRKLLKREQSSRKL